MLPLVAPLGTGTTTLVEVQLVGTAAVPLNLIVLVLCVAPKFTPVIVTDVPARPDAGESELIVGVCDTVKGTPLLAVPLTVITMFPEVAPLGTGTAMLVALQFVGFATTPLNDAELVPWLAPKLAPVIVTDAPGTAVFGDMLEIDGANICGLKLFETLSKVAVAREVVLPLLTPNPTYTFVDMLTV